jgi:hypothetical protein
LLKVLWRRLIRRFSCECYTYSFAGPWMCCCCHTQNPILSYDCVTCGHARRADGVRGALHLEDRPPRALHWQA